MLLSEDLGLLNSGSDSFSLELKLTADSPFSMDENESSEPSLGECLDRDRLDLECLLLSEEIKSWVFFIGDFFMGTSVVL